MVANSSLCKFTLMMVTAALFTEFYFVDHFSEGKSDSLLDDNEQSYKIPQQSTLTPPSLTLF